LQAFIEGWIAMSIAVTTVKYRAGTARFTLPEVKKDFGLGENVTDM
jgi:hypothetical protein